MKRKTCVFKKYKFHISSKAHLKNLRSQYSSQFNTVVKKKTIGIVRGETLVLIPLVIHLVNNFVMNM